MSRSRTYLTYLTTAIGVSAAIATATAPARADTPSYSVPCQADAGVYHNIRYSNGNWQGFVQPSQPPDSCISGITAAYAPDGAHFDVLGNAGLYDNVRHADGSWQGWARPVQPPGLIQHIAAGNSWSGNIYYVASTTTGLYYNVRNGSSGGWGGWIEVNYEAPPGAGPITDVAIAVTGSSLQFMVISGGELWHDVQDLSSGAWQGWAQPAEPPCGPKTIAGAGQSNGNAQFMVVSLCDYVYHNIRYSNGSWQGWAMPPQPPGLVGSSSLGSLAAAIDGNGDGQFTVDEVNSDGTTTLFHIVRDSDGTWQDAWGSPGTPLFYCGRLAAAAPYSTGVGDFQFATYCW